MLRSAELRVGLSRRLRDDDPHFRMIRERWSAALREADEGLPRPEWANEGD